MRIQALAVILSVSFWTSVPTPAFSQLRDPVVHLNNVYGLLAGPAYSKKVRIDVAAVLSTYCKNYLDRVPSLSPREEDWLRTETAAGRFPHQSIEFAKQYARRNLEVCVALASEIKANRYSPNGGEAQNWTRMAVVFSEVDTLIYLGRVAQQVPFGFTRTDLEELTWHQVSRLILMNIVSPMTSPTFKSTD